MKKFVRRDYTFIELVVAAGILVMLMAAFQSSMTLLQRMNKDFSLETQSVLVLGNVMARVAPRGEKSFAAVRAIVAEECGKSGLPREAVECVERNGAVEVSLKNGRGTSITSMKLPISSGKEVPQ